MDTVYIGGFSGGIDSQAACLWMRNRYGEENVVICNSNAGENEHPMTVEHVQWYSENVHYVNPTNAQVQDMNGRAKEKIAELGLQPTDELPFDLMAELKGMFPRRKAQFCTEILKMHPMRRFMREYVERTGANVVRFSGMRRSESNARRNTPFECYDDYFDCQIVHPLADWTKEMCFAYVEHHGEQYNQLYKLGFSRVGCAPCINSNKADILAWAQRFPEMIDKVRTWEERTGKSFFPPIIPPRTKGKINWIDDVVRWAKTRHGGKQFDLLILEERPACESAYGLCE